MRDCPDAILPVVVLGGNDIGDAETIELCYSCITAHEVDDFDTALCRQHRKRSTNCTIGRILNHTITWLDAKEFQEGNRAEWHGDQLRGSFVGNRVRNRDKGASGRQKILGPGAVNGRDRNSLADFHSRHSFANRIDNSYGFRATDRWQLGFVPVAATYGPEIMVVDRREDRPDADLTETGLGNRAILDGEDHNGITEDREGGATHCGKHNHETPPSICSNRRRETQRLQEYWCA